MDLNLPRDLKNKKGFYKFMGDKHKTKKNVGLLPSQTGNLVKLNAVFAPDLIIMTCLQECHVPKTKGKVESRKM